MLFILSSIIITSLLFLYDYYSRCNCDPDCKNCMINGSCKYDKICKCGCKDNIEGFQGSYHIPYDYSGIYYWPAGYWYTGCNETMFGDVKCLPRTANPYW